MITLDVSSHASTKEIRDALDLWLKENSNTPETMKVLIKEINDRRPGTVYIEREIGNSIHNYYDLSKTEMHKACLVADQYVWYSSVGREKLSYIIKKSRYSDRGIMVDLTYFISELRRILLEMNLPVSPFNKDGSVSSTDVLFGNHCSS